MPKLLADLVRKKVNAGVLPLDTPVKTWICLGSGRLCAACGKAILFTEYEPQYTDNRVAIRFHGRLTRTGELASEDIDATRRAVAQSRHSK